MANLINVSIDKDTGDYVLTPLGSSSGSGGILPPGLFRTFGYIYNQTTDSDTWTLAHNANTSSFLVQIYDTTGDVVIPDDIKTINPNTIQVKFGAPMRGKGLVTLFIAGGE